MNEQERDTVQEACDSYINGNISYFKGWLRASSKRELLDAIEYLVGGGDNYHEICCTLSRLMEAER